jgi:hypothetical protein
MQKNANEDAVKIALLRKTLEDLLQAWAVKPLIQNVTVMIALTCDLL